MGRKPGQERKTVQKKKTGRGRIAGGNRMARWDPRIIVITVTLVLILAAGITWSGKLYREDTRVSLAIPEVTDTYLDSALQSGRLFFVYFFSPTCPYCRQATPILARLASELNLPLVKVDIRAHPEIGIAYSVEGVPAVYAFNNGKVTGIKWGLQTEANYRDFFVSAAKKD